jgi:spermidine synthase
MKPGALTPPLRRYLFLTAGITGAVVMVVEILGAKLLSPYVGTSHFVWVAQIATTLVALAAGYYAGGQLVTRVQTLGWLYASILASGLYLMTAVAACEPVTYWTLRFSLPIGSLVASCLLFFVPLALLAMVGPFVVHVLTASLSSVGSNMGRLTAVSTFGSLCGTILIGYVLLPFLPNPVTMYLTALALLAVSASYFLSWGSGWRVTVPILMVACLGAAAGSIGLRSENLKREGEQELFRGNSHFGLMQVVENTEGSRRYLLNDFLTQNSYDPRTKQSTTKAVILLHGLARAYTTNIADVLCIGLGVGAAPMAFAREGVRVDVVEINPVMVPLAKRFFDLHPEQLTIHIGDGRAFLNQCKKRYDVVLLDAFLGESAPSHLMTREAFGTMRRVLQPGGALVVDSFGSFEEDRDLSTASLSRTLRSVFASVHIHAPGNGNVMFVASDRHDLSFVHQPDTSMVHPDIRNEVESFYTSIRSANPAHGLVLTDAFNPVEYYDAINREELRRYLAMARKPHP